MNALIGEEKLALGNPVKLRDDYYHNADERVKTLVDHSENGVFASDLFWTNSSISLPASETISQFKGLAIFNRINDLRRINKYFEQLNKVLPENGYLLINLETKSVRAQNLINSYPKFISKPLYAVDFLINRVLPKCKPTRKLYFSITKGKNRVITLTETLGRLKSCGFATINHYSVGNRKYVLAKKISNPVYDMEPTYGAFVKLKRVGYKGDILDLYKIRTMHPYSEYLQKYVFEMNGTANGDKIIDDFRITNWGKVFRKFWIDELPMLWNWMKGDLKIVGVRPLSEHKFYTYPKYLQEKRTKVKPGLVPPFYADLPNTPEEFFATEEKYLDSYLKKPLRTDLKYFFKAIYNIFVKNARSS